MNYFSFFILRLSILRPKSLWKLKGNMFPGRMLLIRKDSIKNKYQNVSLTSSTSDFFWLKFSIFFDLKIFHFSYNFEWKFSIFLDRKKTKIFDLIFFHFRKFSFKIIWKMKKIEIEKNRKCESEKIWGWRSKRDVLVRIFYRISSDQKHSTR